MLKDIMFWATITALLSLIIFASVTHSREDIRTDSLVTTMTESAQVASVSTVDKSSRVERGSLEINPETFEPEFERVFKNTTEVVLESYSFTYEYRKDGDKVKAIRITLEDDRGTEYTTTVAANISYQ